MRNGTHTAVIRARAQALEASIGPACLSPPSILVRPHSVERLPQGERAAHVSAHDREGSPDAPAAHCTPCTWWADRRCAKRNAGRRRVVGAVHACEAEQA